MTLSIDTIIVAAYFVAISLAGYLVSRKYKADSDKDFITGGRTMPWYKTAFTVIAMAVDPGVIGIAGLGFLWGFYPMQWNGVHVWITAWFAAMFLIPIYWRSKITTTPELLEKRFNAHSRVFFSVVMIAILIVTLAYGVYLGALLLKNFLGWPFWLSVGFISFVGAFYAIRGGMKTVLAIDFYQAIFLLITIVTVAGMVIYKVGGIKALLSIKILGKAGTALPSTIPPNDWGLFTDTFFPIPAVMTWAVVAGLSWLACNFGMVQRLLAARSEKDAQKALLATGALTVLIVNGSGYIIGVGMRSLMPKILPDEAFPMVILQMFPAGIKGLLIAGLMAALLSTIDGMFTASSALFTEDIYKRFFRKSAKKRNMKKVTRIAEIVTLGITLLIVPLVAKGETAMTFLQSFYGDVLGVVVALYLVGIFSKRASAKAAFFSMISGVALAVCLDVFTPINFAYVGMISFLFTVVSTLVFSRLEAPPSEEKLVNLTIHTLSDVKGPWVGLKAWPNLWKWALGLAVAWFAASFLWEFFVRTL